MGHHGPSMKHPMGNPFAGVGIQHPFGGQNAFGNQLMNHAGMRDMTWQTPFGGTKGYFASRPMVAGDTLSNPMRAVQEAFSGNFHGYHDRAKQQDQEQAKAKSDAQMAGLMGTQYGNSLGGGGMAQHFSNAGYDQMLAQYAQMFQQQKQGEQQMGVEGLFQLMALLGGL
jgi:hypothetical protein